MEWVLSTGTAARLCLVLQRGPCRGTWHSRCHPSVPGTANSIPSIRPSVPVCFPIPSMLWAGAACCMGLHCHLCCQASACWGPSTLGVPSVPSLTTVTARA